MLAAVAWFGFGLQYGLSMRAHHANGLSVAHAHLIFLGYFTITTHLLVCVSLTALTAVPDSALGRFAARPTVATALTGSMLLVGLAYHVLLSGIWEPRGWQRLADVLMHYVTPGLLLLWWARTVPKTGLRWSDPLRWCVYPVAYYVWVLLRGVWIADYPYSFFDVAQLGYSRSLLHGLGLLTVFVVIGLALVTVGRWSASRH